uniref:SHSP domain-containing protein n=1 Tax=Skeletonema marinoi TaxID=267567 RepID=A0A7S2PYF0_9STRA|mmetsp:Transcript_583/g.911  ORF Transcript_583/g.911 Transcript_583/m.911 type:complete len:282 (+) Transcript_583:48-893(+)
MQLFEPLTASKSSGSRFLLTEDNTFEAQDVLINLTFEESTSLSHSTPISTNMRFSKLTALALTPALSRAFTGAAPKMTKTGAATSTRLAARDPTMLPLLRRSRIMHDFDRMFEEMDELMESSLASFPRQRPFLSLADKNIPTDLQLRRPLGFEIEPHEKDYNIKVFVPDVEAKDLHLNLEHDGRVLRLKGERHTEEGGMKVQSRFEKSILLAPDVDVSQLSASLSGDTLTVHAPKVETPKALEEEKAEQIEIHYEEPKALEDAPLEEETVDENEVTEEARA